LLANGIDRFHLEDLLNSWPGDLFPNLLIPKQAGLKKRMCG